MDASVIQEIKYIGIGNKQISRNKGEGRVSKDSYTFGLRISKNVVSPTRTGQICRMGWQ